MSDEPMTRPNSEPSACPKCGAIRCGQQRVSAWLAEYQCWSNVFGDGVFHQSDKCRIAELTRENAELRRQYRDLYSAAYAAPCDETWTEDDHQEAIRHISSIVADPNERWVDERNEGARQVAQMILEGKSGKGLSDGPVPQALNMVAELRNKNTDLQMKIDRADRLAAAVDYDIHARLMNSRSRIADARLNYSNECFSAEECMKLLGVKDHPSELADSLTDHWKDVEIAELRQMIAEDCCSKLEANQRIANAQAEAAKVYGPVITELRQRLEAARVDADGLSMLARYGNWCSPIFRYVNAEASRGCGKAFRLSDTRELFENPLDAIRAALTQKGA